MAEIFDSGRMIDIILAIVAIEAGVITFYWRATGKGIAPRELFPNLLAGACLLLAMRFQIAGLAWPATAAALAAAGIASAIDLARRWRQ